VYRAFIARAFRERVIALPQDGHAKDIAPVSLSNSFADDVHTFVAIYIKNRQ
jgi:hypothetical protein